MSKMLKKMTLAAMLIAMSVVISIFCKSLLNFGGGLFRITFENIPIILSGVIMGPFVGAIVGAASDLVSYMLSPQIYPPNLIVTAGATAVGLVSGLVAKHIVKRRGNLQITLSAGLAHLIGSMIIKPIGLYQFYGILVLWRIPLYLIIAPIEIMILCFVFNRPSLKRLFNSL